VGADPGAQQFIARLIATGTPFLVITNNPSVAAITVDGGPE
jgi:hypothetical protein